MKIYSQPDISPANTPSVQPLVVKTGQGAAAAAASNAGSAGVAVTVSTSVRALEQANRGETADVDTDKVNAVRTAIENGTYVVNPEAIADKLLANAQEMLDRTRH
jgi:negative regulator of flagellin synthesis FlgM